MFFSKLNANTNHDSQAVFNASPPLKNWVLKPKEIDKSKNTNNITTLLHIPNTNQILTGGCTGNIQIYYDILFLPINIYKILSQNTQFRLLVCHTLKS